MEANMEETISLKELFLVLRKRIFMIIIITFSAALVSSIFSFYFITPTFESSTQILVNQKKKEANIVQYNEVQTNVQLVNTYSVIIKSPAILEKVKNELQLDTSIGALNGKITVASEKDSQVFSVTVQDTDPKQATAIANKIAEVFQQEIMNIMSVDNVTILSKADVAEGQAPIKPKPLLNVAIAMVVGMMVSVGLVFLLEYLDNTVKTEQDVEQIIGLPVLGIITHMEEIKQDITTTVVKRGQNLGA
jgi:capsular polysaccharide biosynthesis protein